MFSIFSLLELCWFNSDYLDSFWEEAITILLKRPDISVCLNTFAFAFAPNRFAFAQIRNQIPRAALSRRLPPTSQSFDWKNQWVRVQQRLVCPKMHFPHWNIYGSSFVKIIVAIDVKYHLWPGCQSCAFFKAKSSALRTNWAPTANKGFPADLELVRGVAWQQIDPSTSQTGT